MNIVTSYRSRMWDEGANGYARGDGVASLVLKTLSAALGDGDHIECVIRETGVNQDGATQGIHISPVILCVVLEVMFPDSSPRYNGAQCSRTGSPIRKTYEKAGLDLMNRCDRP